MHTSYTCINNHVLYTHANVCKNPFNINNIYIFTLTLMPMSFPESKGGMHRFGLTHNLEPASEHKVFHSTETVNGLSLWNTDTKHGITLLMK